MYLWKRVQALRNKIGILRTLTFKILCYAAIFKHHRKKWSSSIAIRIWQTTHSNSSTKHDFFETLSACEFVVRLKPSVMYCWVDFFIMPLAFRTLAQLSLWYLCSVCLFIAETPWWPHLIILEQIKQKPSSFLEPLWHQADIKSPLQSISFKTSGLNDVDRLKKIPLILKN